MDKKQVRGLWGALEAEQEGIEWEFEAPSSEFVPGMGLGATKEATRWAYIGYCVHQKAIIDRQLSRPRGRPRKSSIESVDAFRAFSLWKVANSFFANRRNEVTILELIQFASNVEATLDVPLRERAFPPSGVLEDTGIFDLPEVGVIGSKLRHFNQEAADMGGMLETLKGMVVFDRLEQLKRASATGASGLGQVTEKEIDLLGAQLGALSQTMSKERIEATLDTVESVFGKLSPEAQAYLTGQSEALPTGGTQSGADASGMGFSTMEVSDLNGVDIDTLTPAQQEALSRRYGDLAERGEGFVEGAAIGGLTGGGAATALTAAPAVSGFIARRSGKPTSQAQARILQALNPEGVAKLDDLGPDGMLIDALGERGRALGRAAANASPEARETLETASRARMAGQSDRLTDSLLQASRMKEPQSTSEMIQGVRNKARPSINAAYDEARSLGQDIDMSAFDDLFQTDMGQKALQEGQRLARDRMVAEGITGEPSTLAILDEAKKALDDMARPSLGQGPNNQQSIAGMLSRSLRQRIDDLMPEYGGARELAASAKRRENAVTIGAEGAKPRVPADYARRAEKATMAHPDEVAQGYAGAKIDALQNRRDTPGAVDTLFGPRRQQDAMQAALGPEGAATVQSQIGRERTFADTHRALTGNSSTARQLIEQSLLGGLGGGAGLATTGDLHGAGAGAAAMLAARHGGGALARRATAAREARVAPVIADMLTKAGLPTQLRQAAAQAPNKVREIITRALMLGMAEPQLKPE